MALFTAATIVWKVVLGWLLLFPCLAVLGSLLFIAAQIYPRLAFFIGETGDLSLLLALLYITHLLAMTGYDWLLFDNNYVIANCDVLWFPPSSAFPAFQIPTWRQMTSTQRNAGSAFRQSVSQSSSHTRTCRCSCLCHSIHTLFFAPFSPCAYPLCQGLRTTAAGLAVLTAVP